MDGWINMYKYITYINIQKLHGFFFFIIKPEYIYICLFVSWCIYAFIHLVIYVISVQCLYVWLFIYLLIHLVNY